MKVQYNHTCIYIILDSLQTKGMATMLKENSTFMSLLATSGLWLTAMFTPGWTIIPVSIGNTSRVGTDFTNLKPILTCIMRDICLISVYDIYCQNLVQEQFTNILLLLLISDINMNFSFPFNKLLRKRIKYPYTSRYVDSTFYS